MSRSWKDLSEEGTRTLSNADLEDVDHRYSIYTSTYGILYMGTSDSGIENATLQAIGKEARTRG